MWISTRFIRNAATYFTHNLSFRQKSGLGALFRINPAMSLFPSDWIWTDGFSLIVGGGGSEVCREGKCRRVDTSHAAVSDGKRTWIKRMNLTCQRI